MRTSIKSRSTPGWKEKLRSECFSRLDAERDKLLQHARQLRAAGLQPSPGNDTRKEMVRNALQNIISSSSEVVKIGDLAAEEKNVEGVQKTSEKSYSDNVHVSEQGESSSRTDELDDDHIIWNKSYDLLTPGEYTELMKALEESLHADLLREEAEYLESLEQQDLDQMVEAHFGQLNLGPEDEDAVLCPVCQDAFLVQRRGVILCPKQDLRLDVAIEGLTPHDLKSKLAQQLEIHSQKGCRDHPKFKCVDRIGISTLEMTCDTCGALEIIL